MQKPSLTRPPNCKIMKKLTLLHAATTTTTNKFILYSTRSNGTHFFVGSATVDKIKNNMFEISKFNSRAGYSQSVLKALFQFFNRINSYLAASVKTAVKYVIKGCLHTLFANNTPLKIKINDISLAGSCDMLMYGYKLTTINPNITFSTDFRSVSSRIKDWNYFSTLFPSDAGSVINTLEPIFEHTAHAWSK